VKRYTPLRRVGLARLRRERGLEDPKYLKFIRSLPCAICGACLVEAAHVGVRGFGIRCSDRETIPLCPGHHRTRRDAHHVLGKQFWEYHGVDRWELIQRYNSAYDVIAA